MTQREVEVALAELESRARHGRSPDTYLSRRVLLSLGATLRAEGKPEPELATRVRIAGDSLGAAWIRAVQDELTLAIGEFAQCLDPRFLDHPDYDMEYTRSARERLEDRLLAARALRLEPATRDSEVLALADRVFATAREKRAREGKRGDAGTASRPRSSGD